MIIKKLITEKDNLIVLQDIGPFLFSYRIEVFPLVADGEPVVREGTYLGKVLVFDAPCANKVVSGGGNFFV